MQRIVITGGTSGIGLACVAALSAAGHTIDVIARRPPNEVEGIDTDLAEAATWHQVDLTDLDAGAALLARIAADRDGLDVLLNNAGVMDFQNAHDADADSIQRHLTTNLAAPMRLGAVAIDAMLEREQSGHVINVASVAGLKPTPKLAVYAASKAGLIQYTRSIAAEYAGRGIRANAIAPGAVQTGLTSRAMFAMIARGVPLGRLQTPEEVAGLLQWLISDAAASVTGAVFSIDGGLAL